MRNFLLGIVATVGFIVLGQFAMAIDGMRAFSGGQPIFTPIHFIMENGPSMLIAGLVVLGIYTLLFGKVKENEKPSLPITTTN